MKILLVTQYYYPERFSTYNIAEALMNKGHDVSVITGKPNYGFGKILDDYKNIDFEVINGVKVHRVNVFARKKSLISLVLNYLSFYFSSRNFVRSFKEDFDVVLSISLSPVLSISPAILYAKKHKKPCVLYCEDVWPESPVSAGIVKRDSFIYRLLFKISKSIYSKLDSIIVSSPSFVEYFTKVVGLANKNFKVVYQPCFDIQDVKNPFEYSGKNNLLYAGNIGNLQNMDLLLDAIKLVKISDVKLNILGSGSTVDSLLKRISNEHLENKVIYLGSCVPERMSAYFTNADCLIGTLKPNGYVGKTVPNKIIQYLSAKKPIIAAVSGDSKKLLDEAGGSFVVSENPNELAEQINYFFCLSEKEKEELANKNNEFYKKNLSTDKLINGIEDELKRISNS